MTTKKDILSMIAVAAFLGTVFGWAMSVEVRIERALNVSGRLEAIEEMLRPLIVEHDVRKELEKRGRSHQGLTHPPVSPSVLSTLRKRAEADANSQINKGRARSSMEQR